MPNAAVMLITAALSTLGFSILFYVHPRRLLVATLGGLLTTAAYLLAGHFLDGELLPNLIGALVGAGCLWALSRNRGADARRRFWLRRIDWLPPPEHRALHAGALCR